MGGKKILGPCQNISRDLRPLPFVKKAQMDEQWRNEIHPQAVHGNGELRKFVQHRGIKKTKMIRQGLHNFVGHAGLPLHIMLSMVIEVASGEVCISWTYEQNEGLAPCALHNLEIGGE